MCGIVGCAGSLYKSEIDALENMLVFSQVRGPHSTGVGSVERGKEPNPMLAKDVGRPDALIDWNKRYDRVVAPGKKFILGHNRWATSGKVNKRNAHPFLFDNILGCHNGTIPEHRLKDLKKSPDDYGTDSETVLANMNEYPLKEVFSKLDGAWAFVWYDNRDNSVNFLRNGTRDLFYTYSLDRQALFWASEVGFLEAALTRNNIRFKEIHLVPVDKHIRWTIPDPMKAFSAPSAVEVTGYKYYSSAWSRFPNRNGNVNQGFHNHNAGDDEGGNGDDGTDVTRGFPVNVKAQPQLQLPDKRNVVGGEIAGKLRLIKNSLGEVKDFVKPDGLSNFDGQGYMKGHKDKDFYRGYRGERLSRVEFERETKSGCQWCSQAAVWGQPVRFLKRGEHICLECNSDPQIVELYGTK